MFLLDSRGARKCDTRPQVTHEHEIKYMCFRACLDWRIFIGISFLCFAKVIHRLERRKAASRSRGKESRASQNTGKKHPLRAVVLRKSEASEEKSILLVINSYVINSCVPKSLKFMFLCFEIP